MTRRGGRSVVMADVARSAGVAPITVSRVINNHATVTEATRTRVEAAIAALGYRSNMAARTLAGGPSRVIGVLSVETRFYGPSHTLFAIEAAARAIEHTINLVTVNETSAAEIGVGLDQLRNAHADGVIIIAPLTEAVQALGHIQSDIPLVVTSSAAATPATVSIDQTHGARLATRHLLDLGHPTVHHVRGPLGWLDADARADGWSTELATRGCAAPLPIVGDWTPRSGYEAGRTLAADPSVTAVFVANDQMALGLFLAFSQAGRNVPHDISVVGFDDTPESEFFSPPLTTITQDLAEVGRRSVDVLMSMIDDEAAQHVLIKPRLVVRSSTARI